MDHAHQTHETACDLLRQTARRAGVPYLIVLSRFINHDLDTLGLFWELARNNPEASQFNHFHFCRECKKFTLYQER